MRDSALFWAYELAGDNFYLHRLGGGLNNEVYYLSNSDSHWVIKVYLKAGEEGARRINAETKFLQYCRQVAPDYIPKLLHTDYKRMCIVQEYICGERFVSGETLASDSIDYAFKFFAKINNFDCISENPINFSASEGYLCLSDHILSVNKRLNKISADSSIISQDASLDHIIYRLQTDFSKVISDIYKSIQAGDVHNRLPDEYICISPSDFGFHNAIKTNNRIKFIDFEFAGLDDPAKTLCDFVMQPRIPVGRDWSGLLNMLPKAHRYLINRRASVMAPLQCLKWRCIIVSCLSSSRYNELSQIFGTKDRDQILAFQLSLLRDFEARWQGIIP